MERRDDDIWRALTRLEERMTRVEGQLEDTEMAQAVQAGVKAALRGKFIIPIGTVPKILAALLAAVALAGGIKGLIGG